MVFGFLVLCCVCLFILFPNVLHMFNMMFSKINQKEININYLHFKFKNQKKSNLFMLQIRTTCVQYKVLRVGLCPRIGKEYTEHKQSVLGDVHDEREEKMSNRQRDLLSIMYLLNLLHIFYVETCSRLLSF